METDYIKQGEDFLKKTKTEMRVKFLKYGKHFDDDTENRDIYEITLIKGGREYVFNFGQSINASGKYIIEFGDRLGIYKNGDRLPTEEALKQAKRAFLYEGKFMHKNKDWAEPNAYAILTCLQKYEVGTIEDFCGAFGYNADSRKAEKIYNAVKEEFANVQRLFNDKEITEMQAIQ